MYIALKHSHVLFVAISVLLFLLRFFLVQRQSAVMTKRWVKIVPHINDTLLLATAIAMLIISQRAPISDPWVTEKVIGVIGYIAFGFMALKGATSSKRWLGFVIALGWLLALFHVAVSKHTIIFG